MKVCLNCQSDIRDTDKYCRKCGYKVQSKAYYIILNVMIIFMSISLVGLVILLHLI